MTIIHISSGLGGGGAEQMVLQLAKQSHPHVRTIVVSVSNDNTLEGKFIEYGIECYFLNVTSFKNKSLIDGAKTLHNILKNVSDAVFHCHQLYGCFFGLAYNLLYKSIPIVFTLHSSVVEQFNPKLLLYVSKPLRKKDIIFSKNAQQWFLKNSVIIPNGIDFEELESKDTIDYKHGSKFNILYLGRLRKEKNPLAMIGFAKYLIQSNIENFIINVVGTGDQEQQLKDTIKEEKLENYFNLFGFQSNVKPYLLESHLLILPSLWEGMPMVLIEAAATKLPVISTPVGSIPDFLNNENATISNLDDFSTAIKSVILNYEVAMEKSEKLYQECRDNFKIENVYAKHLHLYQSLIK
ncbi:MAG: glycosyltransferase family 4 protein [Aquaticitalea sp.]